MQITFSLRHWFVLTVFVATCVGGLICLSRMFAIDPDSERVRILGSERTIQWQATEWVPGLTGASMPLEQFPPQHGWTGKGSQKFRESLISVSYTDYFGNLVYWVQLSIDGNHSNHWDEYIINPNMIGGGSIDGGTRGRAIWDPSSQILQIKLNQYVHCAKIGKSTNMMFRIGNEGITEISGSTE